MTNFSLNLIRVVARCMLISTDEQTTVDTMNWIAGRIIMIPAEWREYG